MLFLAKNSPSPADTFIFSFQLKEEAENLRQKYLKKYSNALEAAKGALNPVSSQVETLRDSFRCQASSRASQVP